MYVECVVVWLIKLERLCLSVKCCMLFCSSGLKVLSIDMYAHVGFFFTETHLSAVMLKQ